MYDCFYCMFFPRNVHLYVSPTSAFEKILSSYTEMYGRLFSCCHIKISVMYVCVLQYIHVCDFYYYYYSANINN